MKQMKLVLAIFIALAVAAPALAFNVEWHGDFNHRASYSTQADASKRISWDSTKYIGYGGQFGLTTEKRKLTSTQVFDKKKNDSDMFAEVKYRLHAVASDDENKVKGVFGLEYGAAKFGSSTAGFGGDVKGELEVRWVYTDIELPFDPASRVTIGLQPVGYNPLLWSDNAAGIKWKRTDGSWKYSLGWFRNDVGSGLGGEDKSAYDDFYAADATYVFENGNSLNAFVIYADQGQEDLYEVIGGAVIPAAEDFQDQEIWIGLAGKGKHKNFSGMFNAIYLTGEVKIGDDDLDRQSYLLHAQVDAKYGKNTYTLGGLFTPGDDNNNDDDVDNFDHIDISTAILGSVIVFDNFADDNSLSQACYVGDQGYKILYAGVKRAVNAKTAVWAKYFWHNTEEDTLLGDDEIGHEFVVGTSYTIMKGLKAEINAGYLVAGDALDGLAEGNDADDIFRTDARLRFKF